MPLTKKERALRKIASEVRRCKKCPLYKERTKAVPGEGPANARMFFVGEAPGKAEDEKGKPFVGSAGKILDEALEKAGLQRSKVFITSILRCRPPNNRNPKAGEMSACWPHLERYVDTISPRVLVALGRYGFKGLTGKTARIGEMRNKKLEYKGIPIVATYHPAAVLYNRKLIKKIVYDFRKARRLSEQSA